MSFLFPTLLTSACRSWRVPRVDPSDQPDAASARQWAAMEFLLESQKKNRTWILLKQLLLLLLRMAAVAAVVLMVAQPQSAQPAGRLVLGGSKTHHIVLLDDSFSMSRPLGRHQRLRRGQEARAGDRTAGRAAEHCRRSSRCCGFRGPAAPAAPCSRTCARRWTIRFRQDAGAEA